MLKYYTAENKPIELRWIMPTEGIKIPKGIEGVKNLLIPFVYLVLYLDSDTLFEYYLL
ncbi:hypothetical protein [Hanstruepera ponticola]